MHEKKNRKSNIYCSRFNVFRTHNLINIIYIIFVIVHLHDVYAHIWILENPILGCNTNTVVMYLHTAVERHQILYESLKTCFLFNL